MSSRLYDRLLSILLGPAVNAPRQVADADARLALAAREQGRLDRRAPCPDRAGMADAAAARSVRSSAVMRR